MSGFTDIHAHFVYGVDDGAQNRAEMEAMLDAAHADGIAFLFATSHVTPGILPFNNELYQQHLAEARQYCEQKQYSMELYTGAEVMYTPAIERYASEHRLPTLADSQYLLMEFVPDITCAELEAALDLMERAGYSTIIAHIERYACMYHGNARKIKERHDVRYQMNCNTVLHKRGFFKDHAIEKWLKDELIDFIATDSHDTVRRPSSMKYAYRLLYQRYGKRYADLITGKTESRF